MDKEPINNTAGGTSTPESEISKEVVRKRPVVLIYRNNDLYESIIPIVVEELSSLGHHVEIQKFPPKTSEREIGNWLKQNIDKSKLDLDGKDIMTDKTASERVYFDAVRGKESEGVIQRDTTLDDIFNEVAAQIILGEELRTPKKEGATGGFLEYTPSSGERAWLQAERAIPAIIAGILRDAANKPDMVMIAEEKIRDHSPLSELKTHGDAVQKIKEWFIRGGVSEAAFSPQVGGGVSVRWTIADRHNDYVPVTHIGDTKRSITLVLPLANLFQGVIKDGLLHFSPDDTKKFENTIRKLIKKEFEPPKK